MPTDVLELGSPDEKKKNGSWTGVFGQLVRDVGLIYIVFTFFVNCNKEKLNFIREDTIGSGPVDFLWPIVLLEI